MERCCVQEPERRKKPDVAELPTCCGWRFAHSRAPTDFDCSHAALLAEKVRASTLLNMLKLGVNIDHVATLREARYRGLGHGEPDPVKAAKICELAGAHGITVHLREDRRHIQDRDVWRIREVVKTRLNLEMANSPEIGRAHV